VPPPQSTDVKGGSGSSENGNLGTRASIDTIIASTKVYVKGSSGVISEHWLRPAARRWAGCC
jgi:hypothetical protein